MIADILTVARKEWKEYVQSGQGLRGGKMGLLIMLAVFGVLLPVQNGIEWLRSPALPAAWSWVPLMLVAGVVADSFAGERERHTLETLLASRLPDEAIFAGKVTAAVVYAWGFTMIMSAVGLVAVNAAHWQGHVTWFPRLTAIGLPAFSLLTSVLAALAGVLVSLRAPTARQAAQMLSIGVMLLLFVPVFGFQALPVEWKAAMASVAARVDPMLALGVVVVLLLMINAMLLGIGLLRFRRARLTFE